MRDILYSRDQLIDLCPFSPPLDDATRRSLCAAGLGRVRSRPRGCRAGKHKQLAAAHLRSADQLIDPSRPSPGLPPMSSTRRSAVRMSSSSSACRGRHAALSSQQLCFATFNTCSIRHKVVGVKQMLADYGVDIMCLTETWHASFPVLRLCALITLTGTDVRALVMVYHVTAR